ncbi:hypothetical protein SAMN04488030_2118 [Aliiroseovarius halocynthiae]|uniref:Uncharacterized protein n=1 Tax=Aliiroseovarius halocynthiae TaxID=985055 RepID=A0A545SRN3_9RHOB|nr:hypothetical protein [Aliiroseovarius halocynthiae]TQV67623.1 hypothetical protein FIL88_10440 [Aliiroseovarius halocynthiae]SMR81648.1 hypothetical protein SAMN04488030_2118 [Aliiroseovarius halocynthiae]
MRNANSVFWPELLACGIVAVSAFLAMTQLAQTSPAFATAVTLDFLITAPFAYWFCSRKRDLPRWAFALVFAIALGVAWLTLPVDNRQVFEHLSVGLPIAIELAVVAGLAYGLWTLPKQSSSDLYTRLQASSLHVLKNKRVAQIFASEIASLLYCFWAPKPVSLRIDQFSSHQSTGFGAILCALASVVLLEAVAVHFAAALISELFAWVLTGSSLMLCVFLIGHARALSRRPHVAAHDQLHLRSGLFGSVSVRYESIVAIDVVSSVPSDALQLALLPGMEQQNVVITLSHPSQISFTHGFSRMSDKICVHVDDPESFADAVRNSQRALPSAPD